jgi:hypothetical protein
LKFVVVALTLGFVAVIPGRSAILGGPSDSGPQTGPVAQGSRGPQALGPTVRGPQLSTKSGLECTRSKNGDKTDKGVNASKVRLASTVVQSGAGASFLSDSPNGMQAISRKFNRLSGVCGRLFDLTLVDDGWDSQRGLNFIKSFSRAISRFRSSRLRRDSPPRSKPARSTAPAFPLSAPTACSGSSTRVRGCGR